MQNNLYAPSPVRMPAEVRENQQLRTAQGTQNADLGEPVVRFAPNEGVSGVGMYGSIQEALADNLGLYAVCEFVVGTQSMETKEGILYSVGRSFVVLYDEKQQNFILCDVFSIKFVTLYMTGQRPWNLIRTPPVPMVEVPGVGMVPPSIFGIGTGNVPHLQNSPVSRGVSTEPMEELQR